MVLKILGVANLLCLLINILRGNFDIAMMNIIAIILCCLNIVSSDKQEDEMNCENMQVCDLVGFPKIKNGSKVRIGKNYEICLIVDHHFNWFQKKMIKWCFGLKVEDYKED